jgi:hypothetical protein
MGGFSSLGNKMSRSTSIADRLQREGFDIYMVLESIEDPEFQDEILDGKIMITEHISVRVPTRPTEKCNVMYEYEDDIFVYDPGGFYGLCKDLKHALEIAEVIPSLRPEEAKNYILDTIMNHHN